MKKSIAKILALVLVAVVVCMALVSCNKLSGTYVHEETAFGVTVKSTYEFDGDEFKASLGSLSISGTYEIDGDKIIFTVEGVSTTESYEKTKDGIKIDGVEYVKK